MLLDRKFKRYAQKGDFMPVKNCPCLNMVSAIIDYYKRQPKRLKVILLDKTHWKLFVEDMKRVDDSYQVNALQGVPIDGSDVTVRKGGMFQDVAIKYEFYTDAEIKPDNFKKAIAEA